MSDTIGPFDTVSWSQDQWYRHAPRWAHSGVNGTPASSTASGDLPFSSSGLSVGVGDGRAWVRGAGFERVGGAVLQSFAANTNATLSRRDRIVLRRDLAAKTLAPVILTGTPASTPTAPSLTQNETGQWDQPLYSWTTPPSSGTNLTSITDERVWIDADGRLVYDSSGLTAIQSWPSLTQGDRVRTYSDKRRWWWDGSVFQYDGGALPKITDLTPNLTGGWSVASGYAPGVYKDSTGLVHLVGGMTNDLTYAPGGNNPVTLPAGFRPGHDVAFLMLVNTVPNTVTVTLSASTGQLTINSGSWAGSGTIPATTVHTLGSIPPYHTAYTGALPYA